MMMMMIVMIVDTTEYPSAVDDVTVNELYRYDTSAFDFFDLLPHHVQHVSSSFHFRYRHRQHLLNISRLAVKTGYKTARTLSGRA